MRIVNFLLAVMFMVFAFIQINDPDPVVWILIYGAMSAVCVMAVFKFYPRKILVSLLTIYLIYSFFFLGGIREWWQQEHLGVIFDDIAKMEHPYIEESREFIGLWICIVVLAVYLIRSVRKP